MRRPPLRSLVPGRAIGLFVLFALVLPSAAAGSVRGTGVGVTPARSEFDLGAREHDFVVTVFNDSAVSREVELSAVQLGQDLDGSADLLGPLDEVEVVGPQRLELAPQESVEVQLRARFPEAVALYGALVVTLDQSGSEALPFRAQVGAIFLLRGPQPWDQTTRVDDVGLVHDADGQVSAVFADVANVGNAHVRPSGTVELRRDGEIIGTVDLIPENVLPGYARRMYARWDGELTGPEPVEVVVQLEDGTTEARVVDPRTVRADVALPELPEGPQEGGGGATFTPEVNQSGRPLVVFAALLLLLVIGLLLRSWRRLDAGGPSKTT